MSSFGATCSVLVTAESSTWTSVSTCLTTRTGSRRELYAMDTAKQMAEIVRGMFGQRLRYQDLIGPERTRLNAQPRLA